MHILEDLGLTVNTTPRRLRGSVDLQPHTWMRLTLPIQGTVCSPESPRGEWFTWAPFGLPITVSLCFSPFVYSYHGIKAASKLHIMVDNATIVNLIVAKPLDSLPNNRKVRECTFIKSSEKMPSQRSFSWKENKFYFTYKKILFWKWASPPWNNNSYWFWYRSCILVSIPYGCAHACPTEI